MSSHDPQAPSVVTDDGSGASANPVAAEEKAAPGSAPARDSANPVAAEEKAAPGSAPSRATAPPEEREAEREDNGAVIDADAEGLVDGGAVVDAEAVVDGGLEVDAEAVVDGGVEVDGGPVAQEPDELAATAAERDRYLALAQRTQADFENYRKRSARETRAAESRGVARTTRELLPALDNLERALGAAAQDDPLLKGVRLVHGELAAALARLGVESYSPLGEHFDPAEHEAMAQQPVEDAESGTVVEVYQAGYRLDGSVIRPARVVVAA